MFKKIAVVAGGVAAAATLALGGVAHAVNYTSVRYTTASTNGTVAGYEAVATQGDLVQFTHIEANLGINGASRLTTLPAASVAPAGAETDFGGIGDGILNSTAVKSIKGGVGIQLCNTAGYAVQIGLVNNGNGTMDVVSGAGIEFNNNTGDKCENGIITAQTGLSAATVILANVPVNHAVEVGLLYTPGKSQGYRYTDNRGHSHNRAGGTATAYAVDDMNSVMSGYVTVPGIPSGIDFNETAAGLVADDAATVPLSEPVPDPDHASTMNRVATWAHVKVNGNSQVNGSHEIQGQFQNNAGWSTYPVAATSDGTATGELFANPHVFWDDHFDVDAGATVIVPVSTPTS